MKDSKWVQALGWAIIVGVLYCVYAPIIFAGDVSLVSSITL